MNLELPNIVNDENVTKCQMVEEESDDLLSPLRNDCSKVIKEMELSSLSLKKHEFGNNLARYRASRLLSIAESVLSTQQRKSTNDVCFSGNVGRISIDNVSRIIPSMIVSPKMKKRKKKKNCFITETKKMESSENKPKWRSCTSSTFSKENVPYSFYLTETYWKDLNKEKNERLFESQHLLEKNYSNKLNDKKKLRLIREVCDNYDPIVARQKLRGRQIIVCSSFSNYRIKHRLRLLMGNEEYIVNDKEYLNLLNRRLEMLEKNYFLKMSDV
ncbi:hypothetical protein SNEBB_009995 [Seison nebaliae]|nr:hypothetical protein SNEBB_009995 [Seison nebaliae]